MKKLLSTLFAVLIISATACKKGQDETAQSDAQQSETTATDNVNKSVASATDNSADAAVGDPSGVTYVIGELDNLTQKLRTVKSQDEFMAALNMEPKLTAEQSAYVLTTSDKKQIKEAMSKEFDVLIPLALKYNILTESQVEQNIKESMSEIDKSTTLGDLF